MGAVERRARHRAPRRMADHRREPARSRRLARATAQARGLRRAVAARAGRDRAGPGRASRARRLADVRVPRAPRRAQRRSSGSCSCSPTCSASRTPTSLSTVGKSEAACRQIASRARRRLQESKPTQTESLVGSARRGAAASGRERAMSRRRWRCSILMSCSRATVDRIATRLDVPSSARTGSRACS